MWFCIQGIITVRNKCNTECPEVHAYFNYRFSCNTIINVVFYVERIINLRNKCNAECPKSLTAVKLLMAEVIHSEDHI
jgi:hypothetical protein